MVSWQRLNTRGFLNVLRKRFLVWRTIAPEVREEYLVEGEKCPHLAQKNAPRTGVWGCGECQCQWINCRMLSMSIPLTPYYRRPIL